MNQPSADKVWYVVRTTIRGEHKACANLEKAGFECYSPMERFDRVNKRSRTIRTITRPLMARYVFVGLPRDGQHFGFVRSCDGVDRFLGDKDNHPIPVPYSIVRSLFDAQVNLDFDDTREARIHRKEEARTRRETIAMRFGIGTEWTVTDGPFASFQAQVENVTSSGMVKALVSIFGRMTPVEFEPDQLDFQRPVRKKKAA